jgi:hypothetical protein
MITKSASFTEGPFPGAGDIDCSVNYHVRPDESDTVTMSFRACNGRHSSAVHLSVESARKLRDALNEVLGEQQ